MEERHNEVDAIKVLDNSVPWPKSLLMLMRFSTGKAFSRARDTDIPASIASIRYSDAYFSVRVWYMMRSFRRALTGMAQI
jgi:hypothetical protein